MCVCVSVCECVCVRVCVSVYVSMFVSECVFKSFLAFLVCLFGATCTWQRRNTKHWI